MHRRPNRKLKAKHITLMTALMLASGCVQATRHSNTMVFGTNTSFGVKVGAGTGETPKIVVGYDRQEAVIMPLVANVAESGNNSNLLIPCNLAQGVSVTGTAKFAVHPCSLVATNGSAQDSYSVLASFGASYDVDGSGAKGGLAQYFSTGIAAQILALKGGAALVSTGDAAKASAANDVDAGLSALITGNSNYAKGIGEAEEENSLELAIDQRIRGTAKANLIARLNAFDTALGISSGASGLCTSKEPAACADAIKGRDLYADYNLGSMADRVTAALNAWTTP
jgi:hypothetical protein